MLRATIPQLVSGYIYAARIVWLSDRNKDDKLTALTELTTPIHTPGC